jgi:hypothetical protein
VIAVRTMLAADRDSPKSGETYFHVDAIAQWLARAGVGYDG